MQRGSRAQHTPIIRDESLKPGKRPKVQYQGTELLPITGPPGRATNRTASRIGAGTTLGSFSVLVGCPVLVRVLSGCPSDTRKSYKTKIISLDLLPAPRSDRVAPRWICTTPTQSPRPAPCTPDDRACEGMGGIGGIGACGRWEMGEMGEMGDGGDGG